MEFTEQDECPVCLEGLHDPLRCLRMPICGHTIHVSCALSAAQYDVRCPLCRTKDPLIDSRQDEERRMFSEMEEDALREEELARRYKRRRSAVIRRHNSLKKLRDRMREEKKAFSSINNELERTWMQLQRRCWNEDVALQLIKQNRRKHQRRYSSSNRRMQNRLKALIGSPPDILSLTS